MKLIWTKNKLPLSAAIRWAFGNKSSHLVLVFHDEIAIHSNHWGVHLAWLEDFKESDRVYQLDVPLSPEKEAEVIKAVLNGAYGRPYDWLLLFYWSWRVILNKCFRIPVPKEVPWESRRAYLCLEVLESLPPGTLPIDTSKVGLVSPDEMYFLLKESL